MNMVKVAIADSNTLLREGLKKFFNEEDGFEVVGEASDDHEAQKIVKTNQPDVLLLDLNVPRKGAAPLISGIQRNHPRTKVLVLSLRAETRKLLSTAKAGAHGYVMKNASPDQLFEAVRTVNNDEITVDDQVSCAKRFVRLARESNPNIKAKESKSRNQLSYRELEILGLVANGDSNQSISEKLGISIQTVKVHLNHIFSKLSVRNRTQAALRYLRQAQKVNTGQTAKITEDQNIFANLQ